MADISGLAEVATNDNVVANDHNSLVVAVTAVNDEVESAMAMAIAMGG